MRRAIGRAAVLAAALLAGTAAATPADPRVVLHQAIDAMGGEALAGLRRVHLSGHSYHDMLEESERPEGPWIPEFARLEQWADLARGQLVDTTDQDSWTPPLRVVAGDGVASRTYRPGTPAARSGPGSHEDLALAQERLALGPERVLLTALHAADLRQAPDTRMQDVAQHVLAFHWHGEPVRLFLNAHTLLPTAVEWRRTHPYDVFWSSWGDVTTRIYYSFWSLEPGGLRYPRQWDEWRNGQPWRTVLIDKVALDGPEPPTGAPDPATRAAFATQPPIDRRALGPGRTIAPDTVFFPGAWNVLAVRQSDGVVVIEAPIATGYSGQVRAALARRYPGVPLKALVTTSDAWPHIGGVRDYVAHGTPLYALDLNRPILARLLAAPHASHPDALARHPRAADWHLVSGPTVLGTGDARIELYPVRGEAGERMMLAYLPARHLLWTSDLVQPAPDGSFAFPEYLTEVAAVVAREHLAVDRVVGMHTPAPLAWSAILAAIAKAQAVPGASAPGAAGGLTSRSR